MDGVHWPREIDPNELDPDEDLPEYLRVFAELGFVECDTDELEAGVEKIAILASGSSFEHVAYQTPDGEWSSKIGKANDIRHQLLNDLKGRPPGGYPGEAIFMARRRQPHELADSGTGLLLP